MKYDIIIIGAGLTGLTTAFHLCRKGKKVMLIEKTDRIGGQIHTFKDGDFIYESGPNTGVVSYPEIAELFQALEPSCEMAIAREESKCRLIWKGNRFHALPSGLFSAITTPLFSLKDKFRILGEPFRSKGTDPNESVGKLARRRLGKSFVDYAVDPFLSGVYAGDPMKLTTRYALPKLYNLEQNYGSFIKGSIAKAKLPKTNRDKLATKKIFSAEGGLESLTRAMATNIGMNNFVLGAEGTEINPLDSSKWIVSYYKENKKMEVECNKVITTSGAYTLPQLLPFVGLDDMNKICNLIYAPVVQVSVGVKDTEGINFKAFGGLVPSREKRNVLGILYPSSCFYHRAPQKGALFSFFIGGVRHPEMIDKSDEELTKLVEKEFHDMLKFPSHKRPDMIKIFRHYHAIPQYREDSEDRYATIEKLQKEFTGLIIAGNLRDGIGMADRIRQGTKIASEIE